VAGRFPDAGPHPFQTCPSLLIESLRAPFADRSDEIKICSLISLCAAVASFTRPLPFPQLLVMKFSWSNNQLKCPTFPKPVFKSMN
jgi:hypothetical protein